MRFQKGYSSIMVSLSLLLINSLGYEALIGLLKWAVPINPEKTLTHLLKALY